MSDQFTPEVAKKLQAYVYRLVDPRNGETFYVGKGRGNRVFAHVHNALNNYAGENYETKDEEGNVEDEVSAKIQTILDIKNAGLEVMHIIHRHGMEDNEAIEVEAALIDAYPGIDNEIGGHNNGNGPVNAAQLIARYGAEEADFGTMKCMVIVVNKTVDRFGVYDAVRGIWKVNIDRARQAEYVFATCRGMIIGAFKPEGWYPAIKEYRHLMGPYGVSPNRSFFVGDEAPKEIQDAYRGKRFTKPKGAMAPVRYFNI